MGKYLGKNIIKNLSSKFIQEPLDHAKQSATDALKTTSKEEIQKTAEAAGDLIANKIANKIEKVPKNSTQDASETVESETEIPKILNLKKMMIYRNA